MNALPKDLVYTVKINRRMDEVVQEIVKRLGYRSKAELIREALREFIIRRKLYSLLDGEIYIPTSVEKSPDESLNELITKIEEIPLEELKKEISIARKEVSQELLDDSIE